MIDFCLCIGFLHAIFAGVFEFEELYPFYLTFLPSYRYDCVWFGLSRLAGP